MIFAFGTRGDVDPALALAQALLCADAEADGQDAIGVAEEKSDGEATKILKEGAAEVVVVTHGNFRGVVEGTCKGRVGFFDVGESLYSASRARSMSQTSAFSKTQASQSLMSMLTSKWMVASKQALEDWKPDLTVLFTLPSLIVPSALEAVGGIPSCRVHLTPMVPTVEHAPPVGYGDGSCYFQWTARLKWRMSTSSRFSTLFKAPVDSIRAEWGLSPTRRSPAEDDPGLHILGYSNRLCRRPSDWDDHVHVVGALTVDPGFVNKEATGAVPPDLERSVINLLKTGQEHGKLVVFAFGSALCRLSEASQRRLLSACVKAAHLAGIPALVLTRGAAQEGPELLDSAARKLFEESRGVARVCLFGGHVSYDWLFARAFLVVCHGGAGTVHAALRNGSAVVVSPAEPEASDQPWWGSCVQRAGVGFLTEEITVHKSGERLSRVITTFLRNKNLEASLRAVKEAMAKEPGAMEAARLILSFAQTRRGGDQKA